MKPLEQTTVLPERYIPWIPLIALAQVLAVVAIFLSVFAPY